MHPGAPRAACESSHADARGVTGAFGGLTWNSGGVFSHPSAIMKLRKDGAPGKFYKTKNACRVYALPPIAKSAMDGAPSFIPCGSENPVTITPDRWRGRPVGSPGVLSLWRGRGTRQEQERGEGGAPASSAKQRTIAECMLSHPSQRARWMGHPAFPSELIGPEGVGPAAAG